MKYLPGNAQHIGERASQQDAFGFSDSNDAAFVKHGGMIAVVADGMGGMAHGQAAGQIATRSFLNAYAAKSPAESIPEALERALHAANGAVLELASRAGVVGEMGTTLVAVALHDEGLYLISVGDSAAFLLRQGRLYSLVASHTHGANLDQDVAAGRISEEEAAQDPERHALTSFLGMEELVDFDASVRPMALQPGDRILVCSDGLSKALDERQITANLMGDPQAVAERLVERVLSLRRPDQDNVTALIVACQAAGTSHLSPSGGTSAAAAVGDRRLRLTDLRIVVPALLLVVLMFWALLHWGCPTPGPAGEAPPAAGEQEPRGKDRSE
ncbi:MAG: serine/threonine-protein phosphatase [bacterium]|nr:serine/threonine-protein phosphatase [bacterium]